MTQDVRKSATPREHGPEGGATDERGHRRGRAARWPHHIGRHGWHDIFSRVFERLGRDNLGLISAGVTFYIFLALAPAMIAMVTLYGIFTDSVTIGQHLAILSGYLPDEGLGWLRHELQRITATRQRGLTVALVVSVGISLWSMNNAVLALFSAMNVAYGETEKRGWLALYLESFMFTIIALLAAIVFLNVFVVLPVVLSAIGQHIDEYGGRIITAPLLFVFVSLAASTLYRFGPSRRDARWKWITSGSVVAASGWIAASLLLSWYLSNVVNYAVVYGSLGALVALLFWIYVSVFVLCLGALINAEIEHQTRIDTTVGPMRPLGRRGAYVADTVGREAGERRRPATAARPRIGSPSDH